MLETITQSKICSKCKEIKSLDNFSKDKYIKSGHRCQCKECSKKYRLQNKHKIIENNKKNKDEISKYKKQYRKKNIEELKLKDKLYYQLNKIKISDKQKTYRENHKEVIVKKQKEYRRVNKNEYSKYKKNYYKTPMGVAVSTNARHKRRSITKNGDVTNNQLLDLKKNATICYWCNVSLKKVKTHIDHYIPLSKGGEHTLSNLVVSCKECNATKQAKDPLEFANSIGKLL